MKKLKRKQNSNVTLTIGIVSIALVLGVLVLLLSLSDRAVNGTQGSASSTNTVDLGPYDPSNIQVLRTAVLSNGYQPATLTAEPGKSIKLIVDGTQATGCYRSIVSRQMGFNGILQSGDNEFDIKPLAPGTYQFSCSMGMIRGKIVVGDGGGNTADVQPLPNGGSCGSGGCGCGRPA